MGVEKIAVVVVDPVEVEEEEEEEEGEEIASMPLEQGWFAVVRIYVAVNHGGEEQQEACAPVDEDEVHWGHGDDKGGIKSVDELVNEGPHHVSED